MNSKLFGLMAMALIVAPGAPSARQKVADTHDFKPGDLVRFDGGMSPPPGSVFQVQSCDPASKPYRECLMVQQSPERQSHARPFSMYLYKDNMTLVGRGQAPALAAPARTAAPAPAPAQTVAAAPAGAAAPKAGGACPRSAYGGPVPGTRPASAALFRQKITDSITMAAYGPHWYGVQLDNFVVGAPIANSVSVRPGVGATRVTNGAPPNARLYPVSTTMSVCEGAPAGSSSWRTSQKKYFCFVSANNEWTCGATN